MADLSGEPGPTVVISQSMYFPWVGLLEQLRLADVFMHYDDVQFARGFFNRVQIKTEHGVRWITVPTRDRRRGQLINEVLIDNREDWRAEHRNLLAVAYRDTPHRDEMLDVVDQAFAAPAHSLADISRASLLAMAAYFELDRNTTFFRTEDLSVPGASSQRLFDLTRSVGGAVYLTGHGARKYLDHEIFERAGVDVQYMNYQCTPYPQLHGDFTPYVTGLDLIANCGRDGARVICSQGLHWREFVHGSD